MQAFSPGIYPRSEALVQATRDLDRGRTTADAVAEQRARDLAQLVAVQQEAELDLLADGMLAWQDLFRPLVEAAEGMEPGPLTRFLDTNSFYRAPEASTTEPKLSAPLGDEFVAALPGRRLVTLPSPFAFAKVSGLAPSVIAEHVLKPALDALDAELVVLSEPFLTREENADVESLSAALEKLSGGPPLALQLVYGDAGPLLEQLADVPVDAIGIDFYATSLDDVPDGFGKSVLAGVVDGRNSALEDPQELAAFATRLRDRGIDEIALVPNGDLQYVSERIAVEKLTRLGAAKTADAREVVA